MKQGNICNFHQIFDGNYQIEHWLKDLKNSEDVAAPSFLILIIFGTEWNRYPIFLVFFNGICITNLWQSDSMDSEDIAAYLLDRMVQIP